MNKDAFTDKEFNSSQIIMNKDIVSEMVQQMGLTPQMADQLQNQQGGMASYSASRMTGLPTTPEEQMRLMEAAQHPQLQPQPPTGSGYDSDTDTESTASTESEINLAKVGLNSPPKNMLDSIMSYLKDPLIVVVLFVILGLSQVSDMIKKVLPAVIANNMYYLLGTKALIMGSAFLGSKLVIT